MDAYIRKEPMFSLCGLNCGLCPRYQTEGTSKCPGCGGVDFSMKHPSCSVITCNKKHDNVEFCFQCNAYPCKKYLEPYKGDSFISYKNVQSNFEQAKADLEGYLAELRAKQEILENLIRDFNDGKSKGFYCIAVNLLPLEDLREVIDSARKEILEENLSKKEQVRKIRDRMNAKGVALGLDLTLKK